MQTENTRILEEIKEQNKTILKGIAIIIQQNNGWETRIKPKQEEKGETITNIPRKKAIVKSE